MLRCAFAQRCTVPFAARFISITALKMPALSPTMTQGNLVSWSKKVGDAVGPGDELAKIGTDKATLSFDNMAEDGFIARHIVEDGALDVPVGTVIGLLVDNKKDIDSPEVKNYVARGAAPAAAAAAPATPTSAPAATSAAAPAARADGARTFASPLARKTAAELGVNLATVTGTGGAVGRVTKSDVENAAKNTTVATVATVATDAAAVEAPSAGGAFQKLPITPMRRVIAQRLTQSKNVEVPHYYLFQECQADSMLAVIKQLNAKGKGEYKISVNDYIIKAIARANLIVPECNTHWHGDHLRKYDAVDVSVAVATPTGLITPIVKDAHAKGLVQISNEVKTLAKQAREGTLAPEQYQGGTISISNLGGMGVESFTAIINPPQSVIIAVGTTIPKPEIVLNAEGEHVMTGKVVNVVNFTASFDHRVVDGAVGASWFKHFKDAIENPLSLLL